LVLTTAVTVGYGDLTLANHSQAIVLIYFSWVILLILIPLSGFLVHKFPSIKSPLERAILFLWGILCFPWNAILTIGALFRRMYDASHRNRIYTTAPVG
jgi:ACR3 family arsenite efflux pump ArsB